MHQLARHLLLGGILVGEEFVEALHIGLAVEGYASPLATVAASTTSFLIVAFDAFGDIVVDDEAHIGFIYAHAKGDGGHDDIHFFGEEFILIFGAHLVVEASVVGEGFDSVEYQ